MFLQGLYSLYKQIFEPKFFNQFFKELRQLYTLGTN